MCQPTQLPSRNLRRALDTQPPVLALDPDVPPRLARTDAHPRPLADKHRLQVHVLEAAGSERGPALGEGGGPQGGEHEDQQEGAVDEWLLVALGGATVPRVKVDGVGVEAQRAEAEEDCWCGCEGYHVLWVLVDCFVPVLG